MGFSLICLERRLSFWGEVLKASVWITSYWVREGEGQEGATQRGVCVCVWSSRALANRTGKRTEEGGESESRSDERQSVP